MGDVVVVVEEEAVDVEDTKAMEGPIMSKVEVIKLKVAVIKGKVAVIKAKVEVIKAKVGVIKAKVEVIKAKVVITIKEAEAVAEFKELVGLVLVEDTAEVEVKDDKKE